MRKLLTGALLLALSIPSYADADSFCESVMGAAESTMRARQAGLSAVEVIGLANEATGSNKTMLRGMIVEAYSSPKYSTDEYKTLAINEFATDYYIDCIKGLSE